MVLLIVIGCVAFITGAMLVLFPGALQKFSTGLSKILLDVDKFVFKRRQGVGISLVLIGAYLFFLAYYQWASGGLKSLF